MKVYKVNRCSEADLDLSEEVIAFNKYNDALVGYIQNMGLGKNGPEVKCENEHENMFDIVSFITIKDLHDYIKQQR